MRALLCVARHAVPVEAQCGHRQHVATLSPDYAATPIMQPQRWDPSGGTRHCPRCAATADAPNTPAHTEPISISGSNTATIYPHIAFAAAEHRQ